MQVTHVQDHVTHAVIGGKQAREAQISNSAEFFNVLSNTLYSDKTLAVVREVMCNAWDIHIETKKTDIPVEITLVDNKLTIRDFGTGIHDDDMVVVYGTYGNSTKKLDGKQTGGFGLGSKAPWAYVDHFEVTSYHDGRKTIYAMSKSSGEVAGKPSILPMVSTATTETGLAVSFNIKPEDRSRFISLIQMIARFGEMNIKLNDEKLKTIPFSKAPYNFLILPTTGMHGVSGAGRQFIFVRYGNVVYPIDMHDKFKAEYHEVGELLQSLVARSRWGGHNNEYSIIFQAKPNTISVTPSRESLSMTDHTISSLIDVFKEFLALKDKELEEKCFALLKECIAKTWTDGQAGLLLTSDNKIPGLRERAGEITPLISNFDQMVKHYSVAKYPSFSGFRRKDILERLDTLIQNGFGNKGKIQSFRKEYDTKGNINTPWFQRVIVQPLLKKVEAEEGLNIDKLFIYGKTVTRNRHGWDEAVTRRTRDGVSSDITFCPPSKFSNRTLEEYLPFLRNIVIIGYNRDAVEDRAPAFPIMREKLGGIVDTFVYLTPRHTEKAAKAVKFFTDAGFTVIDLTIAQPWEHKDVIAVERVEVRKPRKKGLPKLNELLSNRGIRPELMKQNEEIKRVEIPEYVIKISGNGMDSSELKHLDGASQIYFATMYGDKGGVAVNENQKDRFLKLGSKPVVPWMFEKLTLEVQTNPAIQMHYAASFEKLADHVRQSIIYDNQQLLQVIIDTPELGQLFGIKMNKKDEDRQLLHILENLRNGYAYRREPEMIKINEIIKNIPADQNVAKLAGKFVTSKVIKILSPSTIRSLFTTETTTAEQKGSVIDILMYALEG